MDEKLVWALEQNAIERLRAEQHDRDPEVTGINAEQIIREFLIGLGLFNLVTEWDKVPRY